MSLRAFFVGRCHKLFASFLVALFRHAPCSHTSLVRIEAEHVIKALGFSADPTVDRVFGVREMYGYWINANFRLWITTEFPGIDAGKFGGTSFSPGAIQTVEFESWFINYPKDLTQVLDSQMLPRRKGDSGKCTYQCDPRTGTTIVLMLASMIPGLLDRQAFFSTFIRQRQLQAHPLEAFVDECAAEWEGHWRGTHMGNCWRVQETTA